MAEKPAFLVQTTAFGKHDSWASETFTSHMQDMQQHSADEIRYQSRAYHDSSA